jgi:small redox-active disulfide protein 2
MEIKVLGNCCSHCSRLYANVLQAVKELELNIPVEQIGDILTILQYRILRTPALVINGKVVSDGEVLTVEEIKKKLRT